MTFKTSDNNGTCDCVINYSILLNGSVHSNAKHLRLQHHYKEKITQKYKRYLEAYNICLPVFYSKLDYEWNILHED